MWTAPPSTPLRRLPGNWGWTPSKSCSLATIYCSTKPEVFPALLVVQLSSGLTHVVVIWRRHGSFVQVIDPGVGRRWLTAHQLLREVYIHELRVLMDDWQEWARSPEFLIPLGRRLKDIGLAYLSAELIAEATENSGWIGLATLDAATRLTGSLVRNKALKAGREAGKFIQSILRRAAEASGNEHTIIPQRYWSVRPAPPMETAASEPGEEELWLKGAVLVRVLGLPVDGNGTDGRRPCQRGIVRRP